MSDIKIVVKVRAYERGILPTRVSQLQNDAEYATMDWVKKYIRDHSSGSGSSEIRINGGIVGNSEEIQNVINAGEVGQTGPVNRYDLGSI